MVRLGQGRAGHRFEQARKPADGRLAGRDSRPGTMALAGIAGDLATTPTQWRSPLPAWPA